MYPLPENLYVDLWPLGSLMMVCAWVEALNTADTRHKELFLLRPVPDLLRPEKTRAQARLWVPQEDVNIHPVALGKHSESDGRIMSTMGLSTTASLERPTFREARLMPQPEFRARYLRVLMSKVA